AGRSPACTSETWLEADLPAEREPLLPRREVRRVVPAVHRNRHLEAHRPGQLLQIMLRPAPHPGRTASCTRGRATTTESSACLPPRRPRTLRALTPPRYPGRAAAPTA